MAAAEWSDQLVKVYLRDMGQFSLLTAQQEIDLGKQIHEYRRRFRARLLECDYAMRFAVGILQQIHDGQLAFHAELEVCAGDERQEDQIRGRLPHNLRTLTQLLELNRDDYRLAVSRSRPVLQRREAWRRLSRRRRRGVRLIEELGLRTRHLESLIEALEEISLRVDELQCRLQTRKKDRLHEALTKERRQLLCQVQESPTSLRSRMAKIRREYRQHHQAKHRLVAANLRLVVSIAKRFRSSGLSLSDRIQEGNLGLMQAADRFDYRRGFRFTGFATPSIYHRICRAMTQKNRLVRLPQAAFGTILRLRQVEARLQHGKNRAPTPGEIGQAADIAEAETLCLLSAWNRPISLQHADDEQSELCDLLADPRTETPSAGASRYLLRAALEEVLATLSTREREVIELRFGLNGNGGRTSTLEEIGQRYEVTRQRIHTLEARALAKLRESLQARRLYQEIRSH